MLLGTSNAGPLYIELALKLMSECFLLPTKRSSLFHLPRDWYFPIQSKGSSLSVAFCSGIARIPEWGAASTFSIFGWKVLTSRKSIVLSRTLNCYMFSLIILPTPSKKTYHQFNANPRTAPSRNRGAGPRSPHRGYANGLSITYKACFTVTSFCWFLVINSKC